jgi:phosphate butyryltransferase
MKFAEIRKRLAGIRPARIALCGADDEAALESLAEAQAQGLALPVLVGEEQATRAAAAAAGVSLDGMEWSRTTTPDETIRRAVSMVAAGEADLLMKGHVQTPALLKSALDPDLGFRVGGLMSHVAAFELATYPKLLFLTDTGMVLRPTLVEKSMILDNAIRFVRSLGVPAPRVAALSATEAPNPKMPCSMDAAALAAEAREGRFGACTVCGPVDVAIALDPEAARIKGVTCEISGSADIWLVPEMVGGNILGKALIGLASADAGGVVVGGKSPIVLLSRSSSPSDKANSILLGLAASLPAAAADAGGRP